MPGSPVPGANWVSALSRHHGAGEATAVLPSLWRSWATGSVPGALPVPAPPAPRAARHWHTAVPTWVGENIIKHCQPSQDTRHGGQDCESPPSFGTVGKRWQPWAHRGRSRGGGGGENLPAVPPMGRKPLPGAVSCSQPPWAGVGCPRSCQVLTVPVQPRRSPGSTSGGSRGTRARRLQSHLWGQGSSAGARDPWKLLELCSSSHPSRWGVTRKPNTEWFGFKPLWEFKWVSFLPFLWGMNFSTPQSCPGTWVGNAPLRGFSSQLLCCCNQTPWAHWVGIDSGWVNVWVVVSCSDRALPQLLPPWHSLTLSKRSSKGARAASAPSSRQEWAQLLPAGVRALLGQSS